MLKIDESNGVLRIEATPERGALFAAQASVLGLLAFGAVGFAAAFRVTDASGGMKLYAGLGATCGLALAGLAFALRWLAVDSVRVEAGTLTARRALFGLPLRTRRIRVGEYNAELRHASARASHVYMTSRTREVRVFCKLPRAAAETVWRLLASSAAAG